MLPTGILFTKCFFGVKHLVNQRKHAEGIVTQQKPSTGLDNGYFLLDMADLDTVVAFA